MVTETTQYDKAAGMWGVFKNDCYKTPPNEKLLLFIKAFEDYGIALKFAQTYSPHTAIHIV